MLNATGASPVQQTAVIDSTGRLLAVGFDIDLDAYGSGVGISLTGACFVSCSTSGSTLNIVVSGVLPSEAVTVTYDAGAGALMGATGGTVASFGPVAVTNNSALTGTVTSLLNFNGPDGSTTFTDEGGKTWTAAGDAQIDTAVSKFGGASGLFDGTGDYLTTPHTTDLSVANADDITIQAWVNQDVNSTVKYIATKRPASGTVHEWAFYLNAGKLVALAWKDSAVVAQMYATTTLPTGAWHHVAVTRSGTTWRLFVNGTLEDSDTQSDTPSSNTDVVHIARDPSRTAFSFDRDYDGHIDDFQFVKGLARYTASFTPPTYQLAMPV